MTPAYRRALRFVGAVVIGLGLAIMGSAVWNVLGAYAAYAQCPHGDASCEDTGPLILRLAIILVGFGVFVMGIGLLVRKAGRKQPGDPPFVFVRPVIDRATKLRATVTALMFGAAAACWAFRVAELGGWFAFMGALFAVTTVLMHRRKLL